MKKIKLADGSRVWQVLAVAIMAALVAVRGGPRLYTASGDLTLHYDLAEYISHTWSWPRANALQSEMGAYPPLSHYLAALAGAPFHSALLGLSLVAVLGVFACYFLLFDAVLAGSWFGSIAALTVAGAVLAFGRSQHAVIGFEVLWNFFYAQLVGEAVFLLFAFWLCQSRLSWPVRLAITAMATFLCGWLYAIAALQLAMAYIWLEGVRGLRAAMSERRLAPTMFWPTVAGVVVLPPLVVLHPRFQGMVAAAGNEGGMDLIALNHLVPELAAVLLVLCLALGVFGRATERWRTGALFLVVAGCSAAAPALIQLAARDVLHLGSEYAVKKYGFAVVTLLGFVLGTAVAAVIERKARVPAPRGLGVAVAAILAFGVTRHLVPWGPIDLTQFTRYERALRTMMADPRVHQLVAGKVVSRDHDYPWYMNHAATVVDLGTNSGLSFDMAIHSDRDFTDKDQAGYAVIDDHNRDVWRRCVLARSDHPDVALVSTACYRNSGFGVDLGMAFDMAKLSARPAYFTAGWSGKEAPGFWSDGPTASVVMRLPMPPDPLEVSFDVGSFIATAGSVQHVFASVDGHPVGAWTFDMARNAQTMTLKVPANLIQNDLLKIDFSFPDATSPAEHKISTDPRKLAVFVRGMTVGSTRALRPGDALKMEQIAQKPDFFGEGWSGKEATGIWNDGNEAELDMDVGAPKGDLQLSVSGVALLPRPGYVQHVTVSASGQPLGAWTFDAKTPRGKLAFTVPGSLVKNGDLRLDFAFPDAIAPSSIGVSSDTRKMAFFVTSVTMAATPAKP